MKDANEIEYEALNFDGLERRANYRTIAYREDMLHTFERRDAAAIIYQIIYRWQTEYKRDEILAEINRRKAARLAPLSPEEVEQRMWVYMSYNDFVRESGQALGYNTVIRMLHYLVHDMKVVEQRENHDPHYPDYEYRINKITVKTLLKALPPEPTFHPKIPKKRDASTQMGTPSNDSTQEGIPDNQSTQMGTGSTQEGIPTTQMGTEVYPNGGTSHITTHNYSHTDNTEESEGEQSDTAASAPSLPLDASPSSSPQSEINYHSSFDLNKKNISTGLEEPHQEQSCRSRDEERPSLPVKGSAVLHNGSHFQIENERSPRVTNTTPAVATPIQQAPSLKTHSQQGDTHGLLPSGDTDLPGRDDHRDSSAVARSAHDDALDRTGQLGEEGSDVSHPIARSCSDCGRTITEPDCPWCMTVRVSAIPKQTPSLPSAVEPGRSGGPTPGAPASLPGGTSHEQNRDALPPRSVAVEADSGCTAPVTCPPDRVPTPQVPPGVTPPRTMRATVVPAPPKWDVQAMVARAEALREKPFSESARPKETRSARKLFARKPDLTEEEFTSAFQHWNTPWWHETNGPFCITDLAAVPKNKSEMRLIIALEKLAMPRSGNGGQVLSMTRGSPRVFSSYDDPNFSSEQDFSAEGGSYAAAI